MQTQKPYRGAGMEGPIANWYARSTARDTGRFAKVAQLVLDRLPVGSRILEVAPGPGYLAIEIAKSGRYNVTGLDISQSFVHIAAGKAREAGVNVAFRLGNASAMPFADCSFDYVISMAAFKNFSDPVGALNEIFRVLTPGGWASIYDLRKDASMEDIGEEVRNMKLSPVSSVFTRWVFQFSLLKRAYTRDDLVKLVAQSAFRTGEVRMEGIGFELRLKR